MPYEDPTTPDSPQRFHRQMNACLALTKDAPASLGTAGYYQLRGLTPMQAVEAVLESRRTVSKILVAVAA